MRRAPAELTPTEERIAGLAATGLTNRVIAEQIFVSPKTVEANLARVYRKLAIRSRAELGRAMAERERAARSVGNRLRGSRELRHDVRAELLEEAALVLAGAWKTRWSKPRPTYQPILSTTSSGSFETMKRVCARSAAASARRSISIGSSTPLFSSGVSASAAHQRQASSANCASWS